MKNNPTTRRGVLSTTSATYDPIGFIAPAILPAKLLLQQLTCRKADWDECLNDTELIEWKNWLTAMENVDKVRVTRSLRPSGTVNNEIISCEIHCFSDASEVGYGSSLYARLEDSDGNVQCSLILGKSRVAPLKRLSIPRLELTAAAMSVRLCNMMLHEIDLEVTDTVFWTDSSIFLCYIKNESSRFNTFVANRVSCIQRS
ncbi:uncharacterized protein LOC141911527 [Tubulanus polymorphus]|uniref:uncharacterized protein LOC141911527 n=1 Tax=Tubulanus polymorphus TaxID=672921 RepID=UPI003DA65B2B